MSGRLPVPRSSNKPRESTMALLPAAAGMVIVFPVVECCLRRRSRVSAGMSARERVSRPVVASRAVSWKPDSALHSWVSGSFAGGGHCPEHSPPDHSGSADVGRAGAQSAGGVGAAGVAVVVTGMPADQLRAGMIDSAVGAARAGVLHVVSIDA